MSLILALDNDRRQSAQLASLLRTQVEADLIQSASAAEGLAILHDRVPDLILTSTFLSPGDEAALAGYLRDLGGLGAHVQTLTIPALATGSAPAKGKKKAGGMLGALRHGKTVTSLLEGCSPDAFAREVQQYLARALERRAAEPETAAVVNRLAPGPVQAHDPTEEAGDTAAAGSAALGSSSLLLGDPARAPESRSWSLVTPPAPDTMIAPLITDAAENVDALSLAAGAAGARPAEGHVPMVDMPTADDLDAWSHQLGAEQSLFVPEPGVPKIPAAVFLKEMPALDPSIFVDAPEPVPATPLRVISLYAGLAFEDIFLSARDRTRAVGATVSLEAETPEAGTLAAGAPADTPVEAESTPSAWSWMESEASTPLADILAAVAQASGLAGPTAAAAPEPDTSADVQAGGDTVPMLGEELLALIGNAARQASLDAFEALDRAAAPERRERPRGRPPARGNRPAASQKARGKKPRPAQDEWGMFDPAQCGPDALFDEDAWEEEPDDRRPSPRGRSVA